MRYSIGIDLGGTFIKFGLVRSDGKLIYEGILPTEAESGSEMVINNIISASKKVLEKALESRVHPVGIGVGTPGIVDRTNRIVLGGADNLPAWFQIYLADKIECACQLPAYVNNDANMMGLGEQAFGAAQNCSDVVFLTIGTGIGGAVIIDGKLFCGYDNRGTELGHIPLFADGLPCSCGSVGCLEAYTSTSALIQQFIKRREMSGVFVNDKVTGKMIVKLYHENNMWAVESMNDHWQFLGRGIAGLVNIFSPQRVVIGGGISESGAFYIKNLNEEFRKQVMPDCAVNTEICAAKLGNNAGVLGAAQFVFVNSKK